MKNKNYIILLCCLFCTSIFAQNSNIQFYKLADGLSQNTVIATVQDEYGFLWIGTRYGLNRYDGVNFIQYEHDETNINSISNNFINCLHADQEGKIWIGTYGGGIDIYDIQQDTFLHLHTQATPELALSDDYITDIYQDKNNTIWIATEKGGINIYDPTTKKIDRTFAYDKRTDNLLPQYIHAISEDVDGNIWLGTWENGLKVIESATGKIQHFNPIVSTENKPLAIRELHFSHSKRLWLGGNKGIKEIVKENDRFLFKDIPSTQEKLKNTLDNSVILSIYESPDNHLWIGTENNGLFVLNLSDNSMDWYKKDALTPNSLSSNSIWSLFGDKEGTIWIGTYLKGLNKVDPLEQKFEKYNQVIIDEKVQSLELVNAFAESKEGNLWFGTDGNGLIAFDSATDTYKHFNKNSNIPLSSDEITSLLLDQYQNLWIGTWNGGVNLFNPQDSTIEKICKDNHLSGNNIHALHEDSKGRIWIAAFRSGLDVYDPTTQNYLRFDTKSPKRKIASTKIRALTEDSQGNIWIGTEESGLQRITLNDNLEIVDSKIFFSNQDEKAYSINTLIKDSQNNIWIGTEGNGLYVYNRNIGKFTKYSKKDGLPSDMIYAILEDNQGLFWISTNKGIFSFNLQDTSVVVYSAKDGLQANEFCKSSCLKTKEGNLYFGGINGFNQFTPTNIQKNTTLPNVYVTELLISNVPYQSQEHSNIYNNQKINLKYFENDLTLQFTALNFTQSLKNQYQYKLDNYDNHWRNAGTDNTAYYTNIPPGTYTFRVKASNNDGVWNEEGANLQIYIAKPWYATYLAYAIYAILSILFLRWSRNNIIQRERLQGELKLEQLEVSKMQELADMKSQFFANISHEFKTPLTLIISPLQTLKNNTQKAATEDKKYNIMLKNAERLYRLINQILDLSQLESGNAQLKTSKNDIVSFLKYIAINFTGYAEEQYIDYQLNFPRQAIPLYFEKQKMEKVFVNLISNAFKYTPQYGKITIDFKEYEDTLTISIIDTGKGISEAEKDLIFNRYYKTQNNTSQASTGIGLSLTQQIIKLHKGTINVKSQLNKGTTFIVQLPKGEKHLNKNEIVTTPTTFNYSEESLIRMNEFSKETIIEEETKTQEKKEEKPIILVAEDHDDMRAFIVDALTPHYKVLQAEDGAKAYEMAKDHIPDIVITDAMMPNMDGFELSTKLKNDKITSHVFIIMLTVKSTDNSHKEGFLAGVDNYLTKPFNMNLLEMRIQNLLQSRKKYKEQLLSKSILKLSPEKLSPANLDEQFLKDFIDVIEQNISNPSFNIENVCRALGFSKSQFYRKTKSLLDQTPNEFIKNIKLQRAAQLLKDGDYKISEVTYKVGFNDLKHFRNSFKKKYGMTPSEYAQKSSSI